MLVVVIVLLSQGWMWMDDVDKFMSSNQRAILPRVVCSPKNLWGGFVPVSRKLL